MVFRNTNILTFQNCILLTTESVMEDTVQKLLRTHDSSFRFVFQWSKDCYFSGPRKHVICMPMQTSSDRLFKFASVLLVYIRWKK